MSAASLHVVGIPPAEATSRQIAIYQLGLASEERIKALLRTFLATRQKRSARHRQLYGYLTRLRRIGTKQRFSGDSDWLTTRQLRRAMPKQDNGRRFCANTCKAWCDLLAEAELLELRHGGARATAGLKSRPQNANICVLSGASFVDRMAQNGEPVENQKSKALYRTPQATGQLHPTLSVATAQFEKLSNQERAAKRPRSSCGRFIAESAISPTSEATHEPFAEVIAMPLPAKPDDLPPDNPPLEPKKAEQQGLDTSPRPKGFEPISELLKNVVQLFQAPRPAVERPDCILAEVQGRQIYIDRRFLLAAKIHDMHLILAVGHLNTPGTAIHGNLAARIVRYAQAIRDQERDDGVRRTFKPDDPFAAGQLAPRFFAEHGLGGRRWLLRSEP